MVDSESANLSYKELHEQFVSDHEGTFPMEIVAVTGVCGSLSMLLRSLFTSWTFGSRELTPVTKFLVDFTILVLPVLCCLTVAADHVDCVLSALTFANFGLLMVSDKVASIARPDIRPHITWSGFQNIPMSGRLPFVSAFRACMQIATAVSILAVDFVVFPRRFCKAETYGTGLMDVGVGGFVLANAVVSPEARGKYTVHSSLSAKLRAIAKSVTSSLPLWILGLCRLIAVKGSDYQEHTSEYGVHWNFFFSLAVVKVLSTCVLCILDPSWSWLAAVTIGCVYQYLLTGPLELREYILFGSDGNGSRVGLLEANREGLASSFGYLAIYLAGVQLGKYLMKPRAKLTDWMNCLLYLTVLDAAAWAVLYYVEDYAEPVSRRLANLPYVVWILAHNIQVIWGCLLVDIVCSVLNHIGLLSKPGDGDNVTASRQRERRPPDPPLCLLEAINSNGLLYFLLANLQTGAVNLSMATIHATPLEGFTVLVMHMLLLSVTVSVLYVKKISVKFW